MNDGSKKTIIPRSDRVLLERIDVEKKEMGGLVLPDTAKKKPETAKVIAVGPGKRNEKGDLQPIDIQVGDIVLIDKYAGQEITIEENEYMIVRADDVIAQVQQ